MWNRCLCFGTTHTHTQILINTADLQFSSLWTYLTRQQSNRKYGSLRRQSNYRSQWPQGLRCGSLTARLLGLRVRIPPEAWIMSVVGVVCCQVEVFALGWSLVQRSPTECHVSECDREALIMRPWPTRGCCAMRKRGIKLRPILNKFANSLLRDVAHGLNKACFLSRMSRFHGTPINVI